MVDISPQAFLKKMNSHLALHSEAMTPNASSLFYVKDLHIAKELLEQALERYRENHQLIKELVTNYNNIILESKASDSSNIPNDLKLLANELFIKITKAKEMRTTMDQEIMEIRKRIEEIRRPTKRYMSESEKFIMHYKKQVSIFSVVKLEFSDGIQTFLLGPEEISERFLLNDVIYLKTNSDVGRACFGKKIGDEIAFKTQNGLDGKVKILDCSLPSVEQMEQLISASEFPPKSEAPEKTSPFHLHNLFGSNNSRYRKGG